LAKKPNRKNKVNMKRILLTFLAATIASVASVAQVQQNQCATDEVYKQMVEQDPAALQRQELFDQQAQKISENISRKTGQIRIIPVVFHIFHKAGGENITDAQIFDEMKSLNENYRRVGAKATQTRPIFQGVAGDMEVEFRMARKDPDGNCTNGIVRIYEEETENGTDNIKKKSVWPTDRYLNVWVVSNIVNFSSGLPGIAGYAQFPWLGSYNTDGVIILSNQIGSIGTSRPSDATTVTHEVGHWLGCFHPFQDSCRGGDKVDDTPPCADNRNTILSCDFSRNTCANDEPDMPDQIENYMDYTTGTCQNMFTIGQKARMDATLDNWRKYIWSIKNLTETGTDVPNTTANCAPKADFFSLDDQFSRSQYACEGGTAINFRDNSYNYTGSITYQWTFEGGTPATSTDKNPKVSYSTPGKYKVTLVVTNSVGSDTEEKADYIEVIPAKAPLSAPYTQDFEFPVFPTDGWFTNSTTYTDYQIRDVGLGTIIDDNSHTLMAPNGSGVAGSRFDLYSPSFDISGVADPVFSFYYAFAQRLTGGSLTNDQVRVYYSTNCGQTWSQLWARAGAQLSTVGAATPTSTLSFAPSDKSKWKQVSLGLSSISASLRQNVRFRVQFISNGGNNFYIDAINIGFPSSVANYYSEEANFNVYPNPTAGQATVSVDLIENSKVTVTVQDILGRDVATIANGTYDGKQEFAFDASQYNTANGLYFVKLNVNGHLFTKKLMVK
jgi:PKD repeat protein